MVVENFLEQTGRTLVEALTSLKDAFVNIIPNLVGAIIIVIIGWILGKVLKHIVVKVIQSTKIDDWVEEQNLTGAIGGQKISVICGSIVKWYIIAVFLAQAVATFQLTVLGDFLKAIAYYIPLILLALIIVVAGLLIGRYVRNAIESTTHRYKKTVALGIEIVIVYLAVVIALDSIKVVSVDILIEAFKIAFMAFALTIAIIVGIAFGLAFKDDAKLLLKEIRKGK